MHLLDLVQNHSLFLLSSAGPGVEEEVRVAEEKFEESKQLTETAMHNLLENDVSLISFILEFVYISIEKVSFSVKCMCLQLFLVTLQFYSLNFPAMSWSGN